MGLTLALVGFAWRLGVGPQTLLASGSSLSFAGATAALLAAALPLTYFARALACLVLGLGLMGLGLAEQGPLAGLAVDGAIGRDFARLLALVALPAALLFRGSYRSYGRSRLILAVGLAAAAPYLIAEVGLALEASANPVVRWAAALSAASLAAGAFGFLGSASLGACPALAALVLVTLPAELALRELTPLADWAGGPLSYGTLGLAVAAAGVLATLGLYQVLACAFGGEARREIDEPAGSDALNTRSS